MKLGMYKKIHEIIDYIYDLKYGVKTGKYMILKENRSIHNNYEPTVYLELRKLFSKYPFKSNDHIIDYGCGKGRVLVAAALKMCPQITGIEINKEMYDIALDNIIKFKQKKKTTSEISVINMDAKDFKSLDEINKFFFFNPFHLKVFLKIFTLICSSIKKYPRNVTLFFYMPVKSWVQQVESSGVFKFVDSIFLKSIASYDDCEGFGFLIYSNCEYKSKA